MSTSALTVSGFRNICFCTYHEAGFHYVHFDCKNLVGYAEAEKPVPSYPTMTMDKLCNSPIYSQLEPWKSLGFAPHDYLTQEYYDLWHRDKTGRLESADHRYTVTPGVMYDLNSIMHYPSMMNIAEGRDQHKVQDLPLVAWRQATPAPPADVTSGNTRPLYMNIEPTDEDCQGVKNWYPWQEVLISNTDTQVAGPARLDRWTTLEDQRLHSIECIKVGVLNTCSEKRDDANMPR